MTKLQQYALAMQIPQEKAREVFDTISVSGGVMHDSCQILNMLNAKYIIVKRNDDPIPNPHANGNVWFVNQVNTVNSANKELLGLGKINTKKQAIMDINSNTLKPDANYQTDSADRIQMTSYKTKEIRYSSVSKHKGFAVFSEIYYPEGWVCAMDGKEVPYGRVNYVLRGMEIPAGKHEIVWQFKPNSFEAGTTYSMIGSLMLILSFLGVGALQFKNAPKEEEA